jgi:hypothetical protein
MAMDSGLNRFDSLAGCRHSMVIGPSGWTFTPLIIHGLPSVVVPGRIGNQRPRAVAWLEINHL